MFFDIHNARLRGVQEPLLFSSQDRPSKLRGTFSLLFYSGPRNQGHLTVNPLEPEVHQDPPGSKHSFRRELGAF